MLRIYTYAGCDTCRHAVKYLQAGQIPFQEIPIRETPPTLAELRAMRKARGDMRKLFNTAGADYRALGLSKKLPMMEEAEALHLLAKNGNLVKRPFLIGDNIHLTGFKKEEWETEVGSGKSERGSG